MDTKYKGFPEAGERIVYILPISVADLPEEIQAEAEGIETLYAVHRPNGERLALVRDRGMAFALARQNDFAPVNAH
jgi:hypothetical protein